MSLFGSPPVPGVDASEARTLVSQGAALLDVREQHEWNVGHAPMAIHVPLGRIAEAPRSLKPGQRVVVVCRSGNRSRSATSALIAQGFDAHNLTGGMQSWQAVGGSVVDHYNRPGQVI